MPTATSALETALTDVMERRPDARDFEAYASVLHFGSSKGLVRHTLVVEVPLGGLVGGRRNRASAVRFQILALLRDAKGGRLLQRFEVDRSIPSDAPIAQRIVWTAPFTVKSGRYVMEVVAYEPGEGRATVEQAPFDSAPSAPGLKLSSVALLQPAGGMVMREGGGESDDPFFVGSEPVVPTLHLETAAAPGASVPFFTVLYPDRASTEPVTLKLDVVRDGKVVETTPLPLPGPDAQDEIRYAGGIPTAHLAPDRYRLRLHAQQGAKTESQEVNFVVRDRAPGVRLGSAPSDPLPRPGGLAPQPPGADTPEAPEIEAARRLIMTQQFDEAANLLWKADADAKGQRADLALMLGLAYFRRGAPKNAETALRRAIDLSKDDIETRAQATYLLGRTLASAEKKPIHKDSERLRGAEAAFRELLTMPDAYAEQAALGLAETLYRLDRLLEAEDVLATLLERPKLSDVTKDRARLLLKNPRCVTEPCLPNFSFVTEDGELESSDALRGKVVLLSFWATWCRPCEAAVPDLKRVYKVNAKSPFVMIGVNMHDEPALMQRFLEQNEITWPQLAGDHSARLIETMQISAIPTEILFDHDGVLIASTTGWGSTSGDKLYQAVGRATKLAKKQAVAAPSSSR